MKSLFRIIRRYSLSVAAIIIIVLVCNVAASVYFAKSLFRNVEYDWQPRILMEAVGDALAQENDEYRISSEGTQLLEGSPFLWAMAMDQTGDVTWEWQLPEKLPRHYTLQNIASFTRSYLEEYPVYVWNYGPLLLVFGCDPQDQLRFNVMMSAEELESIPNYLKLLGFVNLLLIFFFILFFGYRSYRALKPVAEGIEQISRGEPLHLKEKGMAEELVEKLNQTSEILEQQREKLEQRDEARTEWISGVSHDIRTPLALIAGNADRLSETKSLTEEEQELARTIRRQSLIIGQLIQDLNLTSRLAYQYQPLHKETCSPAFILRECIADLYNQGLDERYEITVEVTEKAEQKKVDADAGLLARALRNLLGNCIRHNPEGCKINVLLYALGSGVGCAIRDSGPGIPAEVVENIHRPDSKVHIMGLRLTAQIIKAHGGELVFEKRKSGTYDAKFII